MSTLTSLSILLKMLNPNLFIFIYLGIGIEQTVDIEQLSEAVPRGIFKPVNLPSGHTPTFIMFDLETTDLSKSTNFLDFY